MQQTPASIRRPLLAWVKIASGGHAPSTGSSLPVTKPHLSHQLLFESLFDPGRALSFPCDDCGAVLLDDLSERARSNYFFARTSVGRDYASPRVIAVGTRPTN